MNLQMPSVRWVRAPMRLFNVDFGGPGIVLHHNSAAFIKSSICSLLKGSTRASSNFGAMTSPMGSAKLDSGDAHAKNTERITQMLQMLFANKGVLLPLKRRGVYSLRNHARWSRRSWEVIRAPSHSPMWACHALSTLCIRQKCWG